LTPFVSFKDDSISYGYFKDDSFFIPVEGNFTSVGSDMILKNGLLCPEPVTWHGCEYMYGLASFLESPANLKNSLINYILGKSNI
jgi:hypothetical protein